MIKKITLTLLTLLFLTTGVAKAQSITDNINEVLPMVKNNVAEILDILKNEKIKPENKRALVQKKAEPFFDFPLITKLSVGPKFWKEMSPTQQSKLETVFEEYLINFYLDRIMQYSNESITYKPATGKGNKVFVPVAITSNGTTYNLKYKFYNSNSGWKMYDFEVEGVSIVQTYRLQFSVLLKDGKIDQLIERLNAK